MALHHDDGTFVATRRLPLGVAGREIVARIALEVVAR
jgi:hypothetical protein